MSPNERETIVNIVYGEDTAYIWSTQKKVWARCKRAKWNITNTVMDAKGRVIGMEFSAPARFCVVTPKNPNRSTRRGTGRKVGR